MKKKIYNKKPHCIRSELKWWEEFDEGISSMESGFLIKLYLISSKVKSTKPNFYCGDEFYRDTCTEFNIVGTKRVRNHRRNFL